MGPNIGTDIVTSFQVGLDLIAGRRITVSMT